MRTNSFAAMRFTHASVMILFSCLTAGSAAFAASINASLGAGWDDVPNTPGAGSDHVESELVFGGNYQPRANRDLVAFSGQIDLSGPRGTSANVSGALYGTDTSRSAVSQTIPELIVSGLGVEPMANITAQVTPGLFNPDTNNHIIVSAGANMSATVQHRVILSPEVTIFPDLQAELNNVPVQVLWRYAFTRNGDSQVNLSMGINSPTGDCPCPGMGISFQDPVFPGLTQTLADEGVLSFIASTTTESRDALYDISILAHASVRSDTGSDPAFADVVFDPFLTVDPDWIYSEYFTVQQESTLNEGEWVAITRDYLAPVPLPASVWLFGSGLMGLIGLARRKKA